MNRKEFLLTPIGKSSEFFNRTSRAFIMHEEIEFKTKKSSCLEDKQAFQRKVYEGMKSIRKRAFKEKTKLFLQLDVYISGQNPYAMQTIPKYYIDLLYNTEIDKNLLMKDDSQIKGLSVKYYYSQEKSNDRIGITLYPIKALLADLELLHSFEIHRFYFMYDEENLDDEIYEYANKISDDPLFKLYMQQKQERILRLGRLDYTFYHFLLSSLGSNNKIDSDNLIFQSKKNLVSTTLNKHPNTIVIPMIPFRRGETKIFKEMLNDKFIEFKKRKPDFEKLYTNIALKVFYVPPVTDINFTKDLDNIMVTVVPIFTEVFKPPLDVFSNGRLFQLASYQIIELENEYFDYVDGALYIVLENPDYKSFVFDLWDRLECALENAIESDSR